MRIAILLSTKGGSPLQVGIERGLMQLGHEVCVYRPGTGYDLIIVFNQVAHDPAYTYPDFPDGNTPVAFVDAAEFGYFSRLPDRARSFSNTFAPGSMEHDTKNRHEQERLKAFLQGKSFPYFLREMHKEIEYPSGYHPIDYPLYKLSECHEKTDREEYLARGLELFCSWGASHPWRLDITEALRSGHRKAEIFVLEHEGAVRLPQSYYFERTRAAKLSVSYDGYGSGSFRMTEVLCRTLLLQGPLLIRTRAPLTDRVNCRTYEVEHDGETFLSTNIAEVMADALRDTEGSFEIYERGYQHVHDHLTEKATAAYLLGVVEKHDWGVPTPLTV